MGVLCTYKLLIFACSVCVMYNVDACMHASEYEMCVVSVALFREGKRKKKDSKKRENRVERKRNLLTQFKVPDSHEHL